MNALRKQRRAGMLFCLFLTIPLLTLGQQVLMQWDFENITNQTCIERATGIADTIKGNFGAAPGVVGKGLRLDGFTTRVVRSGADLKNPGKEFTIEAWVSLGEYPWNWCPVITTESNEVKGYRLMIGPLGRCRWKPPSESSGFAALARRRRCPSESGCSSPAYTAAERI
jgi:hypothetical protein